jgi:hypothetical protein
MEAELSNITHKEKTKKNKANFEFMPSRLTDITSLRHTNNERIKYELSRFYHN